MLAAGARQLSRSLHNGMLARVLASPWSFFDATPRGRIINRFSVDLDAIDSRMYLSGKQSIQNALLMVAKLVTVGIQTPLVLVVGAIAAVLFGFVTVRVFKGRSSEELCRGFESNVIINEVNAQ